MKNTLILSVVILFSLMVTYAQDVAPTQHQFQWKGIPTTISASHPDFKQDEFMLGWQWGGRARITRAELVRQKDLDYPNAYPSDTALANDCTDSTKLFIRLAKVVGP